MTQCNCVSSALYNYRLSNWVQTCSVGSYQMRVASDYSLLTALVSRVLCDQKVYLVPDCKCTSYAIVPMGALFLLI